MYTTIQYVHWQNIKTDHDENFAEFVAETSKQAVVEYHGQISKRTISNWEKGNLMILLSSFSIIRFIKLLLYVCKKTAMSLKKHYYCRIY